MGATTGSFGQPNYQPTQGTGQNPSVSIGFGMEPPDFQEGLQTTSIDDFGNPLTTQQQQPGITQQQAFNNYSNAVFGGGNSIYQPNFQPTQATQQNPSVSIGMPGGRGLFSNMFGNVLGGVGQAFQNAASQPGLTTQQQQAVNAVGNTFGNVGGSFGGGKSGPVTGGPGPLPTPMQSAGNPNTVPLMGGMGSFTNVPAPGQNPSVSMGMPVQRPGNRFIPPMAPGGSARRPIPGTLFPGQQTGLTRPRSMPQPQPMNRFRNRFM